MMSVYQIIKPGIWISFEVATYFLIININIARFHENMYAGSRIICN